MRLHHLEVTAFGPFAGTERVAFDALADGGLFLLTGPTGAGKTSVLDAVCFALYGHVPGTRDGSRSLRSDHAGDDVAPQVVLDVSLRGRRLRITRSPQWERPKRRGAGTTPQQARVLVQERPAGAAGRGWVTLSTRLDEAASLLGGLLGLTLPQFSQVVLLPQGQFAAFLRAGAESRRDLLESLFDTARFTDVERWLVARRQETARALEGVDRRIEQVVAQVAQAAGTEPAEDQTGDAVRTWLADLVEAARSAQAAAQSAARRAEQAQADSADALAATALVVEAHQRRAALQHRLDELLAAAPHQEALAAEVTAARLVAPLEPLVAEAARLQVRLETIRASAEEAYATVHRDLDGGLALTGTESGAAPVPGGASGPAATHSSAPAAPPRLRVATLPSPKDLSALARARRAEVGGLTQLMHDETEADRLADRVADAERTVVELDDRAARLASELQASPRRRAELDAASQASRSAAAAVAAADGAVQSAVARADAAARRDALTDRLRSASGEVSIRTERELAARANWLDLRQARLDGMAAELASSLAPGTACPVCGSAEHPQPAEPGPEAVTREQEGRAAEAAARFAEELADAARQQAEIANLLAAARAAAGGDAAVTDLRAAVAVAEQERKGLRRLAERVDRDARAVTDFGEAHEELLRQSVSLDEQTTSLRQQIRNDRIRLAELRDRLGRARGDDPTVAARADRLERLADALESLAAETDDVAQLEQLVSEALGRAQQAARERGLASVEDVLPAVREPQTVELLEQAVRAYQAELHSVCEQLAEPTFSVLGDAPPPELDQLRGRARAAEADRDRAAAELGRAQHRLAALTELAGTLETALSERVPVADAHDTVDGLSRLAEGKSSDNRFRMSLSGYVLAARLEQVAASASGRLARMSAGRYQVVHSAAPTSGRSRGGLQLRVLDFWTGVERDPASLSGGESFLVSLALALGLAEVVAAEAGGALLDTLFVDEGFGTLDDDTLDEVMGVLDGLRDGGRTVGIVSHVADLRARIPVQLRIEKGRTGSHIPA